MAPTEEEVLAKVQESLTHRAYKCTSLTKLSGGTANYVYRGVLAGNVSQNDTVKQILIDAAPLQDGTKSIVIKHTPPYVASNPAFSLTADRCVSLNIKRSTSIEKSLTAEQKAEYAILTQVQETFGESRLAGVTVATPKLYQFDESANTQIYTDIPSSVDLKNYVLKHGDSLTREQCSRLVSTIFCLAGCKTR